MQRLSKKVNVNQGQDVNLPQNVDDVEEMYKEKKMCNIFKTLATEANNFFSSQRVACS